MGRRSKLLGALDVHKGRDYKAERDKKQQREAERRKRSLATKLMTEGKENIEVSGGWKSDDSDESDESEVARLVPIAASGINDESNSDSSLASRDAGVVVNEEPDIDIEADDSNNDDDEEAIPISDLDSLASEQKEDILPHQRLTINNTAALRKAYQSITLPYSTLSFSAHQSITTATPVSISDVDDDLNRELVFYKQCLDAAHEGRYSLQKEGVPFSRPKDYFAEMVKSDEHMGKIKQKMTDEAASKRASSEAKRQRDLKKFGKQVQIAKLQERDKVKRDLLDKVNILKRKRKNVDTRTTNEEDEFDLAIEGTTKEDRGSKSLRQGADRTNRQGKRLKKDQKFGFGGKKRFSKSTDAASTADMSAFSVNNMKGKKQRLGKARRAKMSR